MKLSVCIDAVMMELDAASAIRQAHRLGFEAVEFWGWEDKDMDAIAEAQEETGVRIAAFCTAEHNLVDENRREDYLAGLKRTIPVAKRLGCTKLISQTGSEMAMPRGQQHRSIVEGLKACAPILEESGITLMIEPLNLRVDHPGYYLSSSDEAAEIIDAVGSPCVKMLFDIYHQQVTEGDVTRRIRQYLPMIGHFHAAGSPGRHELYRSELNYEYLFRMLEEAGYQDFVGLEYLLADDMEQGLAYARRIASAT